MGNTWGLSVVPEDGPRPKPWDIPTMSAWKEKQENSKETEKKGDEDLGGIPV